MEVFIMGLTNMTREMEKELMSKIVLSLRVSSKMTINTTELKRVVIKFTLAFSRIIWLMEKVKLPNMTPFLREFG
jgi:hypothetical protein